MDATHSRGGVLQCAIVTPEATILETMADFVALPLYDGELGIGLDHSPVIGRLGYGELRISSGQQVERFYVDGGFVQVAENMVSVLTERAVAAGELDAEAAAQQLESELARQANGDEEIAIRDRLIAQARGQLRVARRSG